MLAAVASYVFVIVALEVLVGRSYYYRNSHQRAMLYVFAILFGMVNIAYGLLTGLLTHMSSEHYTLGCAGIVVPFAVTIVLLKHVRIKSPNGPSPL